MSGLAKSGINDDLESMFGRRRKQKALAGIGSSALTPEATVIWAVGDIHGCSDLLDALMAVIQADLLTSVGVEYHVVFLGDYVDRGPDSRGVLDRLSRLKSRQGLVYHFLRGNHEDRMEAFLRQPELGPGWCEFGGREALASFGITPPDVSDSLDVWKSACQKLNRNLTNRHRAFLAAQTLSLTLGDFFFCHAGAEPGVPLAQQDPLQLMWIRQRFLEDRAAFDKLIVHGHTPTDKVHYDHRRIGIDTGAYASGILTALRLEGSGKVIHQAVRRGGVISLRSQPL